MDPFTVFTTPHYPIKSKNEPLKATLIGAGVLASSGTVGYFAPYLTYEAKKKVVNALITKNHTTLQELFNNLKEIKFLKRAFDKNLDLIIKYENEFKKRLPKLADKWFEIIQNPEKFEREIVTNPTRVFKKKHLFLFKRKFYKQQQNFLRAGLLFGLAAIIASFYIPPIKEKKEEV